ncbi:MAG: hypothetical protein WBP44_07545 [Gammaproteobacteria bacterium]|jgi:hypothetical protein
MDGLFLRSKWKGFNENSSLPADGAWRTVLTLRLHGDAVAARH